MSDDSAVEAARRIVSEFEEPGRNGWLSSQFWPRSAVQIDRELDALGCNELEPLDLSELTAFWEGVK